MTLADAHIHFFRSGYRRPALPSMLGEAETAVYDALRQIHGLTLALAIGYEADGIDPENNAYIRGLAATRPWLRTLAYLPADSGALAPELVVSALAAGHSGVAIYLPDQRAAEALSAWPAAAWQALAAHHHLVSLNARPPALAVLRPLFATRPAVTFLLSHLGLPGTVRAGTTAAEIDQRLAPLLALSDLPNIYVKISGIYAMSEPAHDYPHQGAAALIARVLDGFGGRRCLWASDFAPALEFVSFAQAIAWPGLDALAPSERRDIMGGNLTRLLRAE